MHVSERFTDRVEDYARYRPGYPAGVFDLLARKCGLGPSCAVADVGSGTGIFAKALLEHGATVFAIEPNAAMRAAAERDLASHDGFRSVAATAEATTLDKASVDLVTCAQSFHWFDKPRAKREFQRVLKPGAQLALVWNERLDGASPFMVAYERALWDHCPDYHEADHRHTMAEDLAAFFAPQPMRTVSFPNEQRFDLDGLIGRSLSSSYAPKKGTDAYAPFIERLESLFDEHQEDGRVVFAYEARVYFGRI